MKLKYVKVNPEVPNPEYIRNGDIAFDLRNNEDDYILKSGEWKIFKSGIKLEIPQGYVGSIRDRSGLPAKHAIHTMGGVVDPNYRGEIGVILINLSKVDFTVEKDMRIAQMLIHKAEVVEFVEAEELSETNRGEQGFNSSGYK